jgi:membrane protease YdiL (CAAX protease family)
MTYDMDSRKNISYFGGFFILIGLLGAGLIAGGLVSILVWKLMTGRPLLQMQTDMYNPAYLQALRMVQLVSTFFIFFLPAVITAGIMSSKPAKFLGFNKYFSSKQILLVIGIMLVSLPIVGALSEINKIIPLPLNLEKIFKGLEETYTKQAMAMSKINGFGDYLFALLVMALAPAILEEMFFRGGVQNLLTRWIKRPWWAIIITSLIFSAIHFSYYGFLPRVALGIILGLIYYYSNNLWLAILAHFFNNALIVTTIYYYTLKGKSIEASMNESSPIWLGAIALVILIVLIKVFKNFADKDRINLFPPEDRVLEEKWIA